MIKRDIHKDENKINLLICIFSNMILLFYPFLNLYRWRFLINFLELIPEKRSQKYYSMRERDEIKKVYLKWVLYQIQHQNCNFF